jgi:hypothetical protein
LPPDRCAATAAQRRAALPTCQHGVKQALRPLRLPRRRKARQQLGAQRRVGPHAVLLHPAVHPRSVRLLARRRQRRQHGAVAAHVGPQAAPCCRRAARTRLGRAPLAPRLLPRPLLPLLPPLPCDHSVRVARRQLAQLAQEAQCLVGVPRVRRHPHGGVEGVPVEGGAAAQQLGQRCRGAALVGC